MLLELQELTVEFGGIKAVNGLNLTVNEKEIFALIGPNGAGKTTVLNAICGFYRPKSGNIHFQGNDLLRLKTQHLIRFGISRSFQNVELFADMSVLDNLLIGLHSSIRSNFFTTSFAFPFAKREEKEAKQKAIAMLEIFGIDHLYRETVKNLPFGVQKMVDIARAIMPRPKLILLDEPVAGMNATETAQIGKLIQRLRDEMNITVLMIEHDMSLVMNISDRIAVLDFGKKIAEGAPLEIQNNPQVIEAYLGEDTID